MKSKSYRKRIVSLRTGKDTWDELEVFLPERSIKKDYSLSTRIERSVIDKLREDSGYGSCPSDMTRMVLRCISIVSSKKRRPIDICRSMLLGVK